ncbi:MAG: Dps family protein [Alphaproteobacteria bacterium]
MEVENLMTFLGRSPIKQVRKGMTMNPKPPTSSVHSFSFLLANTYALLLKTQTYHWNVEGRDFFSLHKLFEEHYRELFEAVDEIAEQIRIWGNPVVASFQAFSNLSIINEASISQKEILLSNLFEDHETMIVEIKKILKGESILEDEAAQDLLVSRLRAHEKMAWMLRSSSHHFEN